MSKYVEFLGPNNEYQIRDKDAHNYIENTIKDVTYDSTTGILSFFKFNEDGTVKEIIKIDLPVETIVKHGTYNNIENRLELTLANDDTIFIDITSLAKSINQYASDNNTLHLTEDENGYVFSISNEYKEKINLAYTVYETRNEYVKKTEYATSTNPGVVKIGNTLTINNGKLDIAKKVYTKLSKYSNVNLDKISLGLICESLENTTNTITQDFSTDDFSLDINNKLELSQTLKNRLDTFANKDNVLPLTGGNMLGDIGLNMHDLELATGLRLYSNQTKDGINLNDIHFTFENVNDEIYLHTRNKSGTIALTSDLDNYLNISGGRVEYIEIGNSSKLSSDDNGLLIASDNNLINFKTGNNIYSLTGANNKTYNLDKFITTDDYNIIVTNVKDNNGVLEFYRKNSSNPFLSVNLSLKSAISSGRYDDTTKSIILTLTDESEIIIPVQDLLEHTTDNDTIIINSNNEIAISDNYKNKINNTVNGVIINNIDYTNIITLQNQTSYNNGTNKNTDIISFNKSDFIQDSSKVLKINPNLFTNYATKTDINEFITKNEADLKYQLIGEYATKSELIKIVDDAEAAFVSKLGDEINGDLLIINNHKIKSSIGEFETLNTRYIENENTSIDLGINTTDLNIATNNSFIIKSKSDPTIKYLSLNQNQLLINNQLDINNDSFSYTGITNSFIINNSGAFYNDYKLLTELDKYVLPIASDSNIGGVYVNNDEIIKLNRIDGKLYSDMSNYMSKSQLSSTYQPIGNYVTKDELNSAISTVYKYKGSLQTYNDLPTSDINIGDVYNIKNSFVITSEFSNIEPGTYYAGSNVAWNGTKWTNLNGVFDTTGLVSKQHLTDNYYDSSYINNNYLNRDTIENTYLNKTEIEANYVTNSKANSIYARLDKYATNNIYGVVIIDKDGTLNAKPTISITNGSIHLTKDNIKNALGYEPLGAKDLQYPVATNTTSGGVIIDKDNINKTITIESDGNIYLTKDNIKNALGYNIYTQEENDNRYVTLTSNQSITGIKEFTSGDNRFNLSESVTDTWYSLIVHNDLKMLRRVNTDKVSINPNTGYVKLQGITNGTSSLTFDNIASANKIKELENLVVQLHYENNILTDIEADNQTFEIGSTNNQVEFTWRYKTNPDTVTVSYEGNTYNIDDLTNTSYIANLLTSETTDILLNATATKFGITVNDTKNIKIEFLNYIYYGSAFDDSNITGLNKEFINKRNKVLYCTCNANEYIYVAYPARFNLGKILYNGFVGGFNYIGIKQLQNSSGYTEDYIIYRSENTNLGTIKIKLV